MCLFVIICFHGYSGSSVPKGVKTTYTVDSRCFEVCTSGTLDFRALTVPISLYYSDLTNLLSVALNMYSPVPIYIRHADLGNTKKKKTNIDLCTTCETHVAGQVLGARWTNGTWSLSLKIEKAIAYLVDKVKTLIIYNQNVEIHGDYPISKPVPNEKNYI